MQTKEFNALVPASAQVLTEDTLKAKKVSLGKTGNCLPFGAKITIPANAVEMVILDKVTLSDGREVDSYKLPAEVNGEKKFLTISRFVAHIYADELGALGEYLDAHKDTCKTMLNAAEAETLFDRVKALANSTLKVTKRFVLPYTPYGKTAPSKRVFTVYEDVTEEAQ
jgi:hypothetical protein